MAATIGAAALLVAVCWFGATTKAPPAWEISVFDFFNTLPSPVGNALAALMWFGTTVGILIAALAASLWKRNDISTHVLLAGLLAWLTQRSLKPLVDRETSWPRPTSTDTWPRAAAFHLGTPRWPWPSAPRWRST